MYRSLILSTLLVLLIACKTDPPATAVESVVNTAPPQEQMPEEQAVSDLATNNKIQVPNATTLIPEAAIGKIIKQDPGMIEVVQGNPLSEKNYQSAFIKWPDDFPNAGILVQVSRNPVYDEYRDWAISYIDSKITSGENLQGSAEMVKFNKYTELGDSGAYSYEAGKYYWRIERDYVITIAFNMDWDEKEQYRIATELGKEIMKKF